MKPFAFIIHETCGDMAEWNNDDTDYSFVKENTYYIYTYYDMFFY